ncbi:MAG: uroporphyrinogen decarboxylase [Planctomycetes bacterium]|nr:uroporphyrinogen decarboxylase [Planctomycetota bacterium]
MEGVQVVTGRARVSRAFRCEPVDRVPWVPFVGVHAAALLGESAETFLKSEALIVRGVQAAIDRYRPDGIPVLFDLQLEAEVLGCPLHWAKENPPAVCGHPLANGTALADLKVPSAADGRIASVLAATGALREANPDVALYGLITGPFTLALHLLGTDIFMRMFDDPSGVHDLLAFCRDVGIAMAGYYMDAGCDVIAVVDPMTSQIGPDQFAEFVTPAARPVFDAIRAGGRLGSFFVCGHAQQNIVAMCECGPDNVSIDENIPLEYVRDVCVERGISFGGNLQLTSVLLLGGVADAQANALACLDVGGQRGFILAPGCDLPYAVPAANIEAVTRLVVDPYQRDVARALAGSTPDEAVRLDMREYGRLDQVVVDIITLDSEACAPCQYMVDAVRKVAPQFEGIVRWREHKIKTRDSLVFMDSLMVRNVPTICIDGQITFVSRIPPRDELIAAIQRQINEKMRTRIRQRKATLLVLGDGEAADRVQDVVDRAVAELGADVPVERVGDPEAIAAYGVAPNQVPAVVLARYQLKSVKAVPEAAAVKEWIKEAL